jgi:hypothetical protein
VMVIIDILDRAYLKILNSVYIRCVRTQDGTHTMLYHQDEYQKGRCNRPEEDDKAHTSPESPWRPSTAMAHAVGASVATDATVTLTTRRFTSNSECSGQGPSSLETVFQYIPPKAYRHRKVATAVAETLGSSRSR